jgi:membrane protein DedA with SNARE-associated domain
MEEIVQQLSTLNPLWIYVAIAVFCFVENIFPPAPSDMLVVACGSFIGFGTVSFTPALFLASVGSTIGFVVMYKIGDWFGDKIVETGRLKFIPLKQVRKVEGWFQKYGYAVIVGNRFLSGTRAVVSFFAGLSELSLSKTIILSFVSAAAWNAILLYAGKELGENWKDISYYLQLYSRAITSVLILALLIATGRYLYRKRGRPTRQTDSKKTRRT